MAKKDFNNATIINVLDSITQATADVQEAPEVQEEPVAQAKKNKPEVKNPRTPYSRERAQEMAEAGTTQGRKGCKATRINMVFQKQAHDYMVTMARVRGETITQFTNHVILKSMQDNAELYEKAKAFKESL